MCQRATGEAILNYVTSISQHLSHAEEKLYTRKVIQGIKHGMIHMKK